MERLPAAARVQARERPGRRDARAVRSRRTCRQVSSDGKTYTLTLRKGLKYSDGTPVKASDFTYAIKRDLQDRLAGRRLLHEHRRRRQVREDEEGRHHRDHDGRRDRQDHDQARRRRRATSRTSSRRVRGARAGGLAGEGSVDEPDPVDGPVHDPELQAEQAGASSSATRTSTPASSTATCRRRTRTR